MNSVPVLGGAERLAALRRTALLDSPADESFDRLTRLAARLLNAPVALVSLVDEDRQFFKSQCGLPDGVAPTRETPLSHSFCQYVVGEEGPLVIEDARAHPLVRDNLAIRDLNVIAYLGIPLRTSEGHVLGSFCVIDTRPRPWTQEEVRTLSELAQSVMTEIELRTEIAERERVEAELRASEQRFRQLAENIREVFWITDPVQDRLLYVSPAFEEIWGRPASEFYGGRAAFLDTVHPDDRDRVIATTAHFSGDGYSAHYRIVRPDGQIRWIEDRGFPVRENGEVQRIVGVAEDVTDEKLIQDRRSRVLRTGSTLSSTLNLRRALRETARILVPGVADVCAIHVSASAGRPGRVEIAAAERGMARTLRASGFPEALEAEHPERTAPLQIELTEQWAQDRAGTSDPLLALYARGIRSVLRVPLVARGRTLGALWLGEAVSKRPRYSHQLGFAQDIGRRLAFAVDNARLYARARRAARAREEVLAIVSHELRRPLHAIGSGLDLLLEDPAAETWQPRERESLRSVRSITASAARLVEDLLDVTRIEAGHLRVERGGHSIQEVLAEAERLMEPLAREAGVELVVDTPGDLPAAWIDRARILQVLWNLIGNALQATTQGGSVRTAARLDEGDQIRVEVTDTGRGIAGDRLRHIFQRGRAGSGEGVGLGLAIARGIVEAHGGRIGASSREGKGSTLHFTVPVAAHTVAQQGAREEGWLRVEIPTPPQSPRLDDASPPPDPAAMESLWRRHLLESGALPDGSGPPEVAARLREQILTALHVGHLTGGARLPSIREVAAAFGVGYYAALRAYQELSGEGLVEMRNRSGIYVSEQPGFQRELLGETPRLIADFLTGAFEHRLRVPLLPDLLRRYTGAVTLHCACVETSVDGQVALCDEVRRHFGLQPVAVDARTIRPSVRDSDVPTALLDADVVVTTAFHAPAVRAAIGWTGKPIVVATLAEPVTRTVEQRLAQGFLRVVCADQDYAEWIRAMRGGRYAAALEVILADDLAALAAAAGGDPVLMTRAAHEQLQDHEFRLLVPLSPLFSPAFSRELSEVLVHLNATAPASLRAASA